MWWLELASAIVRGVSQIVEKVSRQVLRLGREVKTAGEAGMATAEYALVTLAAAAFAGLLLAILRGGQVRDLLMSIVTNALSG